MAFIKDHSETPRCGCQDTRRSRAADANAQAERTEQRLATVRSITQVERKIALHRTVGRETRNLEVTLEELRTKLNTLAL